MQLQHVLTQSENQMAQPDNVSDPQQEIDVLRAEVARLEGMLEASAAKRDHLGDQAEPLPGPASDASMDQAQKSLAEAQHHVRNMLAMTRLIFVRTTEGDVDLDEVKHHFLGRLSAISRISTGILRTGPRGTDLEDLIRDELLSVGVSDGPQLVLRGPEVSLGAEAAEGLGLALHELTTNALKFGALRGQGSRLDIRWSTNTNQGAPDRLELIWSELGVPAVTVEPSRYGFGSELILEALPYRLGAETELGFLGGGVRCSISLPLPEKAAASGTMWR